MTETPYKIDREVPPPERIGSTEPGPERRALDELQPGESILFPKDKAGQARGAARNKHEKNKAWFYTTLKQPDGSLRIWRLAEQPEVRKGGPKKVAAFDKETLRS